jgi:Dolichyl-phosphate-mannose-protein mannosyltransferase
MMRGAESAIQSPGRSWNCAAIGNKSSNMSRAARRLVFATVFLVSARARTTSMGQARTCEPGEESRDGRSDLHAGQSWRHLIFPGLMLVLYLMQCIWFVRTQSLVFDEPLHLRAGLEEWRYGRFGEVSDHPPLGHLLPTLPIAHGEWNITFYDPSKGLRVQSITPDPVGLADRTRPVNVMLGVILGVLLWGGTRRIFSAGAANVAISLFAFSPSLIAHFSLVTTDGVCTLMVFATAVQILRWRSDPSRAQTVILGLVLGLLILAKLSTPPVFCLTLVLVLVLKPDHWDWSPRRWNWRAAALATCVAMLVVWAGYFFHVSRLRIGDGRVYMSFPHQEPFMKDSVGRVVSFMRAPLQQHLNLVIPAGEYLEGVAYIVVHNQNGHKTFLNGKISSSPNFTFHIVIALLKWPPVVWLFFLSSAFLLLSRQLNPPADLYIMLLYPACFSVVVALTRITMGERHFLPVYPFVLLVASGIWEFAVGKRVSGVENTPSRRSSWAILITVALLLNVLDVMRYGPDYLSYMNIMIPSRCSYRYLSDSNLDWGQGLLALRRYEAENPKENIHLGYFGIVDPKIYGIRATPLKENERTSGTVVISATNLAGQYLSDPLGYQWVTKYPLRTVLNHSLFVFAVPAMENNSKP